MASAEDIIISKVCLAGWRIEETRPDNDFRRYSLWSPEDVLYGYFWTRYTAALHAEESIWADVCTALPDAARANGGSKTFRLPPR